MADFLRQITDNIVVAGLSVFALALGFFAIRYLSRRHKSLDQARMAALVKGLHYAGVARDVLSQPRDTARDHVLRGLRWLLGAAALSGTAYGYVSMQPAGAISDAWAALRGLLAGSIPAAIGLAHLIYAWILARLHRRALPTIPAPNTTYRTAAYRAAVRR